MRETPEATIPDWAEAIGKSRCFEHGDGAPPRLRDAGLAGLGRRQVVAREPARRFRASRR